MSEAAAVVEGLEFDEGPHVYRYRGRQVPSVTQVLDALPIGYEHVDPEVLRRAAEFGTDVHHACHLYNLDELDREALDPLIGVRVDAWAQFLEDTGAVVLHSECRVYSEKHAFAGTLDNIVHWGRSRRLVDIKSGILPRTVGPQTAAYAEAWREMTGQRVSARYCVQLRENGTYKLTPLKDATDFSIFLSALNIKRWYERA